MNSQALRNKIGRASEMILDLREALREARRGLWRAGYKNNSVEISAIGRALIKTDRGFGQRLSETRWEVTTKGDRLLDSNKAGIIADIGRRR